MGLADEVSDQLYEAVKVTLAKRFGEEKTQAFDHWLMYYREDPSFLLQVFGLIKDDDPLNTSDKEATLTDDTWGFTYFAFDGKLIVRFLKEEESFTAQEARIALQLMSDACEVYLPLGSVVDLDTDKLKDLIDPDAIDNFRVVITQRMAAPDDVPLYFNYGATVYPVGIFKGCESIYFSSELIKDVVSIGYSDDIEVAYIAAMKSEYLFKRNLCSYAFASKKDRLSARKAIAEKVA